VPELLTLDDGASLGNAVNLETAVQGGMLAPGAASDRPRLLIGSFCVLGATWPSAIALPARADGTEPRRARAGRPHLGQFAADIGADDRPAPAPPTWRPRAGPIEALFSSSARCYRAVAFFDARVPAFRTRQIGWTLPGAARAAAADGDSNHRLGSLPAALLKFFTLAPRQCGVDRADRYCSRRAALEPFCPPMKLARVSPVHSRQPLPGEVKPDPARSESRKHSVCGIMPR
jgi:hypothetical protein